MKLKHVKQDEAKVRQTAHSALTVAEKIAKLDALFGPGQGAKKERAKLAKVK